MSGLSLTLPEGKLSYGELERENSALKEQIALLQSQIALLSSPLVLETDPQSKLPPSLTITPKRNFTTPHPSLFTPYHNLTHSALQRFSRHLILRQVSPVTQNKWLHSRVLIIGAGGLGAPVALYLASAGIGHMTLVDQDVVDESNLHRQIIHNELAVGQPKVISAAQQCLKINSGLSLQLIQDTLHAGNAVKLALDHDIIVDCTDNITARYLTSDVAVYTNRPLISAAVVGTNGQLTTYCYKNGPCYRCVNPTPPPPGVVMSCSDAGVIGALVGVVGTAQALETLKVLAHIDLLNDPCVPQPSTQFDPSWPQKLSPEFTPLSETMLFWDGMTSAVRKAQMRPRQVDCMCWGLRPDVNNGPQKLKVGDGVGAANVETNAVAGDELLKQNWQKLTPEKVEKSDHCGEDSIPRDENGLVVANIDAAIDSSSVDAATGSSVAIDKKCCPQRDRCRSVDQNDVHDNGGQNLHKSSTPNNPPLSAEDIELIEIELQKRTVAWACELVAKPVHKPPADGVDVRAPMKPSFRFDRIETSLLLAQIQQQRTFTELTQEKHARTCVSEGKEIVPVPFEVAPHVKNYLGNLLNPLLVDVRFPEQFQTVSVPTSIYLEHTDIMRTPNQLREMLWEAYYHRYPQHCVENPAVADWEREVKVQDEVAAMTGETTIQRKKRYRQYQLENPPKYQLKSEVSNMFNYSSQGEQECVLNLHLAPKTVIHSLPELSITSPRNNSNGNPSTISPTEKVIFNELEEMPILHISFLCRRGRWTMMLLEWFANYVFTTYFQKYEDQLQKQAGTRMSVNLGQTIPTISSTFAFMAICCGFPPIVLSDVFGGLTALTEIYPDFPTY